MNLRREHIAGLRTLDLGLRTLDARRNRACRSKHGRLHPGASPRFQASTHFALPSFSFFFFVCLVLESLSYPLFNSTTPLPRDRIVLGRRFPKKKEDNEEDDKQVQGLVKPMTKPS